MSTVEKVKFHGGKKLLTFVERKLKALEMGRDTDCTFLVGPDDHNAQEIHGSKLDLLAASEYFESLFRSILTPPGPVRVKHIEPHIFRMVVEYAHVQCLRSEVADLDSVILLARAADEFLMDGVLTGTLLEKYLTLENAWSILNEHHINRFVATTCLKFLCASVMKCLEHSTFLLISGEAFATFAACTKMNLEAESVLVSACVRLANSKATEEEKRSVVRSSLSHLRLLAVAEKDLEGVFEWLMPEEKRYLLYNLKKHPTLFKVAPPLPDTLSSRTDPRCTIRLLNLEPAVKDDVPKCFRAGDFCDFSFRAKEHLLVLGFNVLCRTIAYYNQYSYTCSFDLQSKSQYQSNLKVTLSVIEQTLERKVPVETTCEFETNSWVHYKVPSIYVPKEATVKVSVDVMEDGWYRGSVGEKVKDTFFADPVAQQLFGNLEFANADKDSPAICLVKDLEYSVVY